MLYFSSVIVTGLSKQGEGLCMPPLYHTDFARALQDDIVFTRRQGGHFITRQQPIGDLMLPSGHIVACEPATLFYPEDISPFVGSIPSGRYPVVLTIAQAVGSRTTSDAVACACIEFTATPATRWELARRPEQIGPALPLGWVFGYRIRFGLSCLLDHDAVAQLPDHYYADLRRLLEAQPNFPAVANLPLDSTTGANIIAFSAPSGDGPYASYWGYDAQGTICCLVTDFLILFDAAGGKPR